MKIISKNLKKGFIKLLINSLDDLWSIHNILIKGDLVTCKTTRKIKKTEGQEGKRKTIRLKLRVEKIEWHPYVDILRILGKIIEAPEEISLGKYHTFNLKVKDEIKIEKQEWKKYEIDIIKESLKIKAKVLICVFEPGIANFALLRTYGIQKTGKYKKSISGKREIKRAEKEKEEFFIKLAEKLETMFNEYGIEKIILGGAGFSLNDFSKINKDKKILKKCVFIKVSETGITGINELIKSNKIKKAIYENRVIEETEIIEKLFSEIAKNGLITYGLNKIKKAAEVGAVKELLVNENIIRKKEIEELIKKVEITGGKTKLISIEHEAGEKLKNLGGVAAFLRFRI